MSTVNNSTTRWVVEGRTVEFLSRPATQIVPFQLFLIAQGPTQLNERQPCFRVGEWPIKCYSRTPSEPFRVSEDWPVTPLFLPGKNHARLALWHGQVVNVGGTVKMILDCPIGKGETRYVQDGIP